MSEYFSHWLRLGQSLTNAGVKLPQIFCVNWFRTDDAGRFVWPGFGDNMRVLKWMLERVEGKAGGVEHLFGITPRYDDISWEGLSFDAQQFDRITAIDDDAWSRELALHRELFEQLNRGLPPELTQVESKLSASVGK